jgi:PKD repeat protein
LTIVLLAGLANAGTTTLTPTTTLAAETGNNTSAANTFQTLSDGNLGASNISKLNVHRLMPAGSTTRLYAHVEGWWGKASHINIGYNSHDTAQVTRQVNDMISRGIDGIVFEWYGKGSYEDQSALLLRNEIEKHPGFTFYINIDVGTLQWASPCLSAGTCTATDALDQQIAYVRSTYFPSPNYNRINGQPIIGEFGVASTYTIDWSAVQAANPDILMMHRNTTGYSRAATAGAYSWLATTTTNWDTYEGLGYLNDFYSKSKNYPSLLHFGSVYKGFDDTLASWGQNRHIGQLCGQTWRDAWATAAAQSAGFLYEMQLVTWNDYEEGTEIESGIDGCNAITATTAGSQLSWALTGSAANIDHYNVFASTDGQNLALLATLPVTQNALDLSSFNLAPGTYSVYVQGYALPTVANTMSNPASYLIANQPPSVTLSLTPTSGVAPQQVSATLAASSSTSTISSTTIDFGDGSGSVSGVNAAHQYGAAGTYTVTATATDALGVSSSTAQAVTIAANQPPLASLSLSPGSGYAPLAVTASAANSTDPDGTVVSSSIDFGDGTVVPGPTAGHTYATPGARTVTATVTDDKGASTSTSGTVSVNGLVVSIGMPAANATVVSPVRVTGSGSPGASVQDTQIWIDGVRQSSSLGASIDATLPLAPGQHRVVVLCEDLAGTAYKTVEYITVDAPPVAALSVTPASGVVPVTVTASTASSTDPDGSVASSQIDFGDGTVVTGPSATHAYSTTGTKTITATITDNLGASATTTATVTVNPDQPPVAALSVTPSSGIAPLTITASTAGSSDPDGGSVVAQTISFGDGTSTTSATAAHTYSKVGTYTVTAKVTDNGGLSSTTSTTVTAQAGVKITSPLNGSTVTSPVLVSASAASAYSISKISLYVDGGLRYSGSGKTAISTSVSMSKGPHVVTVVATDSARATYRSSVTITVQ